MASANVHSLLFTLIIVYIITLTRALTTHSACESIGPCACKFKNGSGVIDISSLGKRNGTPRFAVNPAGSIFTYTYNPCFDFTEAQSGNACKDVALCQTNNGNYIDIGEQALSDFGYNATTDQIYIKYKVKGRHDTSVVFLVCSENDDKFTVNNKINGSVFSFTLSSKCACPGVCLTYSLSTGTILLIVLLFLVMTYLCVGVLYNKAVAGARGKELIPNQEFWADFPFLIKDGYLFFISPCVGGRAEYQSYEKL